ncbi:MAG: hypothetical protein ACI3XR_07420 [Eubacteriales bacterium]
MKRFLCLTLCLFLLLCLPACGEKKVSLTDRGMEVISLMNELLYSDEVTTTVSSDIESLYFINALQTGDYTEYRTVYEIGLPQNMDELILAAGYPESDLDNPALYAYYEDSVPDYIWTTVNSQTGGVFLPRSAQSAAAICKAVLLFTDSDLKLDTIYLYVFEKGMPAAVSFCVGEGGAVRAQGQWILDTDFPTDAPENIRTYLENLFPGCAFSVTAIEG